MPRSNSSVPRHKRHKKIVKLAKGYYGARKSNFRTAKDAVEKSLQYSYRDRRNKKRVYRRLWIVRINAQSSIYSFLISSISIRILQTFFYCIFSCPEI
jgi:large subunit ribosomal protein L20